MKAVADPEVQTLNSGVNQPLDTPYSPPTPSSEPDLQTTPHIKPLKSIITLGIIFAVCGLVMLLRINNLEDGSKPAGIGAPASARPTPTPNENTLTAAECAELKYTIRTELDLSRELAVDKATQQDIRLRLDEPDAFKALIPNPNARDFMYYPEAQKILYIEGKSTYEDPTGTRRLHLYNLKDKSDIEIFSYQTAALEAVKLGTDYDGLSGMGLSDDGKKIVITSNAKVWIYTLETQELKQVFADQGRAQSEVFYAPQLSPDQSKILLPIGHYEGSSSAVLDLVTGKLVQLPYTSYVVGARPLIWDGSLLLVLKYDGEKNEVCWQEWDGSKETCPIQLPLSSSSLPLNKQLQGLVLHSESTPSGEFVCNNVNSKYEVKTDRRSIKLVDLKANKISELVMVDATNSSGMEQAYDIRGYAWASINGQELVVVKMFVRGTDKYLAIDPAQPTQYQVLRFE